MKNRGKITLAFVMMFMLLLASPLLFSQEDVVENISKVFSINENSVLDINTKYGDVEIRNWDKNEIKIDVKIIIRDLTSQKAKQAIESIHINLYKEGNIVYAKTQFDDEFFKIVGDRYNTDDKKFEINYVIQMPSANKLKMENKYGNVFINKLESKSILSVKYGNLQVNQLLSAGKEEMTEIYLGYSNATIENCKWLKLDIKYSKININESQALVIMSKYSKVNIEKNSSIVSESKYDSYRIGTLNNFVIESQYSNIRIDELKNKLRINTKYTDTKIGYVPPAFESIEIENSYGSISIGIDALASYHINGFAKYAKIHYPSDAKVNRFQENTEMKVEGIVGSKKSDLPFIKIETQYGSIDLVR